jgi:hypothetical protein
LAGTKKGATPQFFISDEDKEAMVEQLVPQTIYAMERLATVEKAPLADDYLDIVARAAAAMLAADTNLDTPAKRRLGAETVAAHILRHLDRYRAEEAETGIAAFHRVLGGYEVPDALKQAWRDS